MDLTNTNLIETYRKLIEATNFMDRLALALESTKRRERLVERDARYLSIGIRWRFKLVFDFDTV